MDCGRPEENFWKTLFEQAGHQELIADDKYTDFLEWKPDRSNCPELDAATTNLIQIAPIERKATMRNIFVARAFKGDANAEASSFKGAGIIEINYGLSVAAMIYCTLFSQFYDSIQTAGYEIDWNDDDHETTLLIVEEIERSAFEPIAVTDQAIHVWAAERHVYATHSLHSDLPRRRKESDYFNLVLTVEEFVVGHEYCHHMLGHTDPSFRHSLDAKKTVRDWLQRINADGITSGLNENQRQELEADVGAFLLVAGMLSGSGTRTLMYRAVGGSMLALIAMAHVSESWVSGGDNHPDYLLRYEVMSRLIKEATMGMPLGEIGDHPLGYLIQFRGFISAVLQTWASKAGLDIKAPNFLNIFSWMIDLGNEFREEFERGGPVE
ncbi:hypothetical protein [Streptomyces sp. NBC_01637]|uniref:hypothetical protein n=1 Tax=unclassified Streptomyces TaxID=2593676 RepID=UPI003866CCF7|nr:hypothetical protein OH719_32230 [Streptomyces sp. NBC_01653]WTD88747.1 hypothetical protein OG891_14640 [Streptomyces sp. NBC_01637]